MTREIKFRAWDKKEKLMVSHLDPRGLNLSGDDIASYAPECVWMQFTGLKDKNGKEIYEGDIVETEGVSPFLGGRKDRPKWMPRKDVVEWKDNGYSPMNEVWASSGIAKSRLFPEVIGNIYENPELI